MNKTLFLFVVVLMLLATALVPTGSCQMLNPYTPFNAVTAEPPPPIDMEQIPRISRVYYEPCPWWGPYADHLLDVPPVSRPFPGPYGIPVPVP